MNDHHTKTTSLLLISLALFFISGCSDAIVPPAMVSCPGVETDAEAIAALNRHRKNAIGLKAGGQMLLEYYDNKDKLRKENLGITLRFFPPDKLFFRGNILSLEIIRLGMNPDELWVQFKPAEISSYYWGKRPGADSCLEYQRLSPNNLVEAIGMVNVAPDAKLEKWGGLDMVTFSRPSSKSKRIYIDRCDYLARRIEYLDAEGNIEAVTELDDYQLIENNFVPAKIVMIEFEKSTHVELTLSNIKKFEPTQAQLTGKLFKRPSADGFKNVYKLDEDCRLDPQ